MGFWTSVGMIDDSEHHKNNNSRFWKKMKPGKVYDKVVGWSRDLHTSNSLILHKK